MLNHIDVMGRLVRDPELRTTQNGTPVCSFTIACERDHKKEGADRETDFIDCVAWNDKARFVSQYFFKGKMAAVSGKLQGRNWTDDKGNSRHTKEVICDNVYFGDEKRRDEQRGPDVIARDFAEYSGNEELPF